MTKLKLGPSSDDRPVKLNVELPATVHRDLVAYAAALAAETGGMPAGPEKLVAPPKAAVSVHELPEAVLTTRVGYGLLGIRALAATHGAVPATGDDAPCFIKVRHEVLRAAGLEGRCCDRHRSGNLDGSTSGRDDGAKDKPTAKSDDQRDDHEGQCPTLWHDELLLKK